MQVLSDSYECCHIVGHSAVWSESESATHWFLTRLIFDPEDGGDVFLRNVGSHTDH
jgi:hypothetical protein